MVTFYDILKIVAVAFPQAADIVNIQSGFSASGIYPYNRKKFIASAFSPVSVIDRPLDHSSTPSLDKPLAADE